MNKEQIIKALECCAGADVTACTQCPIDEVMKDDCKCFSVLAGDALALINDLTARLAEAEKKREDHREYMRNYLHERRINLKMLGRCTSCGETLDEGETMLMCEYCRKRAHECRKRFIEKKRSKRNVGGTEQ